LRTKKWINFEVFNDQKGGGNSDNCQIFMFGFEFVAKYIVGWLKFYTPFY
jgi:hypothetical protein